MHKKRIFLASSAELAADRKEVELLIDRKNKDWIGRGISLELVIWEDFLDVMAPERLRDEYGRVGREGDIFVMLFWTKLGPHTQAEFTATLAPPGKRRPFILAYFKDFPISMDSGVTKADLKPMWQFQEQLQQLGHVQSGYKNADALKLHLSQQLDYLAADGFAALEEVEEAGNENESDKAPGSGPTNAAGPTAAAGPTGADGPTSAKVPVPPVVAAPRRGSARTWISVALIVAIAAGVYGFMRGGRTNESGAPAASAVAGADVPQADAPRMAGEMVAAVPTGAAAGDGPSGQEVFAMACAVCHDSGVAGAPKMGDAAVWAPRIAQGKAVMYQRVLKGYQGKDGFMPAKGGRTDLSDQAIINAVDHMVASSQ